MKGWRIWGGVISLCVLWFWIICFWHIGEPSGKARHLQEVSDRARHKDVMVLPPAMPATTPKPRVAPPSQNAGQHSPPRRKPLEWSRWKPKATTTTTTTSTTSTATTTTITTTTTTASWTWYGHRRQVPHYLLENTDMDGGGGKPSDEKTFGAYHPFSFRDSEREQSQGNWEGERQEAQDDLYEPINRIDRADNPGVVEDNPMDGGADSIEPERNDEAFVKQKEAMKKMAKVGYGQGELSQYLTDKQRDWKSEVIEEITNEGGIPTDIHQTYSTSRTIKIYTAAPIVEDEYWKDPAKNGLLQTTTGTTRAVSKEVHNYIDASLKDGLQEDRGDGLSGEVSGKSWWDNQQNPETSSEDEAKAIEVKNLSKEARLQKLLERAKSFRSPYYKDFEAACKDDTVLDLMEDPFPIRWAIEGYDHSFGKAVKGSLLDDDHWLLFTMHNKLPPMPKNYKCQFEDDVDYEGHNTHFFEGLTDKGCCDKCMEYGDECQVSVMSSLEDTPPRTCWLKTEIYQQNSKVGVRACWKPGTSPSIIFPGRKIGDKNLR